MGCAACHARGTDPSGKYRFPTGFVPGANLGDYFVPFPLAHNFERHALVLFEELRVFGLTTRQSIDSHLVGVDYPVESDALIEAFGTYQVRTRDWGVVLDPGSSDRLLVFFLARMAPEILNRHQTGATRGRLPCIARLARRFVEMVREVERGSEGDLAAPPRDGVASCTAPALCANPERRL